MKYRKKPVVIEAFQWFPDRAMLWPGWATNPPIQNCGDCLEINTLEGVMTANPGDWIIRGVKGEVYPCKPDIFSATYEAIDT